MVSNSKHARIFSELQEAKGEGILESDLFKDWENPGNTATIKSRVKNYIAKKHIRGLFEDAIIVENGRWYLHRHYWSATRAQVDELLERLHSDFRIKNITVRNNYTTVVVVVIFSVLLFSSYNVGVPNTLDQCGDLFGVDITLDE